MVDRIVDLLFLLDIYFNFNTGFVTEDNLVELDRSKIQAAYIFEGLFFIDLISSLPYELVVVAGADPDDDTASTVYRAPQLLRTFRMLRIFKIVKLLRLARLATILVRWEKALFVKHSVASITKFFTLVVFVAHWSACIFHAVALENIEFGPPNWILFHGVQDDSDFERYIMAFYCETCNCQL